MFDDYTHVFGTRNTMTLYSYGRQFGKEANQNSPIATYIYTVDLSDAVCARHPDAAAAGQHDREYRKIRLPDGDIDRSEVCHHGFLTSGYIKHNSVVVFFDPQTRAKPLEIHFYFVYNRIYAWGGFTQLFPAHGARCFFQYTR